VEHWAYDGSPPCGAHIKTLQDLCKAQGRPDSEWLELAAEPIKLAERQFKEAVANSRERATYIAGHPAPQFETMGGPAGDRRQVEVVFLRGLNLAAARDKLAAVMFGAAVGLPTAGR
jgi:hypothetical protein